MLKVKEKILSDVVTASEFQLSLVTLHFTWIYAHKQCDLLGADKVSATVLVLAF